VQQKCTGLGVEISFVIEPAGSLLDYLDPICVAASENPRRKSLGIVLSYEQKIILFLFLGMGTLVGAW
jgi:hypothetical protein